MSTGFTVLDIPSYKSKPSTVIGASSYLMDRFVPACEVIAAPPKIAGGGKLEFGIVHGVTRPAQSSGRLDYFRKLKRNTVVVSDSIVFDFRRTQPQNWAHFLNYHLAIFFKITTSLSLEREQTLILLPENIPTYILAAAELFELSVLTTEAPVEADYVDFTLTPGTVLRAVWVDCVQTDTVMDILARESQGREALPDRVFLARRDTRSISNMEEVEALLADFGFVTLYPEDLPVIDQFRLFREAQAIVAIHGAGMAPLLYRNPELPPCQMVEIMPCGHMTDVFRVMSEQVGCDWIGVRGRMKPEYLPMIYETEPPFDKFSLDPFEVDPRALEQAFSMAARPIRKIKTGP